jgi:diguanylate cyclase
MSLVDLSLAHLGEKRGNLAFFLRLATRFALLHCISALLVWSRFSAVRNNRHSGVNPSSRPQAVAGASAPMRAESPGLASGGESQAGDAARPTTMPAGLDVGAALLLVERAGRPLAPDLEPGSMAWLQALINGLCEVSSRDALTGLANRRQFELALDRELDRVARMGEPALILIGDIDHFKRVNDTHGHLVGDQVIKAVAQALQDSVRPMDTVARLGGEEFAIVLPNCPPAFGLAVAERIRAAVERVDVFLPSGNRVNVTLSLGGAFAPQWVRSSANLWVERADRQLYRAKQAGRNCAFLEQTPVLQVSAEEKGLLFGTSPLEDEE